MSETEISCDEVLAEVEHYLHGELDPEVSAVLARHLSSCSPCWRRAEFQRRLKEIVRFKCSSDQPSEDFVLRIRRSIRARVLRVEDPPSGPSKD